MPPAPPIAEIADRLRIFRSLLPYFGKIVPASLLRKTAATIPGIDRVHPLIEGIYKPAGAVYPLSVASMLKSPYADELNFNPDRTWWIHYSPKAGGLRVAANVALSRSMRDRQPLIILRQVSNKLTPAGTRYRLLGLGVVEGYNPANDLFRIRGLEWHEVSALLGMNHSDDLIETALRLESLEQWAPFVAEDRAVYQVSAQRRDSAFRGIVLENYGYACAVTGQRFHSFSHVEADGAHIIGKEVRGTDDPRNGIALSKSIHWAFDRGLFTISDQYEIVINPKVHSAGIDNFPLIEMSGRGIQLPTDSYYRPHPEALAWHKAEVFDRFAL